MFTAGPPAFTAYTNFASLGIAPELDELLFEDEEELLDEDDELVDEDDELLDDEDVLLELLEDELLLEELPSPPQPASVATIRVAAQIPSE